MPTPEEVALQKPPVQDTHQQLTEENYSLWDEDDPAPEWFDAATIEVADTTASVNDEKAEPIELTVTGLRQGERLDKWLAARLTDTSRSRLQQWITSGHVQVNGLRATIRQTIWNDDAIAVQPQQSAEQSAFQPEAIPLDVVYEDETLLVLNKPAGLVVHPAAGNWSGTLLNGLLHHAPRLSGLPRAGIVHRLDKDTSGLMVVAKTLNAQTHLVRQLQARTVKREYLALVHGRPPESGVVNTPIGRHPRDRIRMATFKASELIKSGTKPAVTHFHVLQYRDQTGAGLNANSSTNSNSLALVCCRLETGRTHQIRVHMQSIGHALVGDPLYGRPGNAGIVFARQALHAWQLGLIHPESGEPSLWQVPLPADFSGLLKTLGFDVPIQHVD